MFKQITKKTHKVPNFPAKNPSFVVRKAITSAAETTDLYAKDLGPTFPSTNLNLINNLSSAHESFLKFSKIEYPTPKQLASESTLKKNANQAWSLLEACIEHKDYERALELLDSLHQICKDSQSSDLKTVFMEALNQYLVSWSNDQNTQFKEVESFFKIIPRRFEPFQADGRSFAVLLRKALDTTTESNVERLIKPVLKNEKKLSDVLRHMDVLSVVKVRELAKIVPNIENFVPVEFKSIVSDSWIKNGIVVGEVRAQLEALEAQNKTTDFQSKDMPSTVNKSGYDQLMGVDSFGLKVIRHSLLALEFKSGDDFLSRLRQQVPDLDQYIDVKSQSFDFFEMYCSLPNEQAKAQFNELLSEFNEERQRQLEARSIEGAEQSWKRSAETAQQTGGLLVRGSKQGFNAQLWQWYQDMLPKVAEIVESCTQLNRGEDGKVGKFTKQELKDFKEVSPFMTLVSPEKMCVITILEILRLNSSGGVYEGMKSARAVISVGREVEQEYRSQSLLQKERKMFQGTKLNPGVLRKALRKLGKRSIGSEQNGSSDLDDDVLAWTADTRAKVGSLLASVLLKVAKVPVEAVDPRTGKRVTAQVPAISHTYQYHNGTRTGVLKLHKVLFQQLGVSDLQFSIMPQSLPMLNEPRPWVKSNDGGYYFSRNSIVRAKDSVEQIAYINAASKAGNLKNVFAGLNVLGKTAWTVNRRVLGVVTQVWNTGEAFLDIPVAQEKPNLPPAPARDAEPTARRDWQRICKTLANEYNANRSLRCDTNYKLEVARALVGERFYFPHNMDFRGRTYPISPHLNHLGNDVSRSLLMFWDGRKLGPRGLFWLKVHLANLFGHSKMSLSQRANFVDENLEKIHSSAEKPLENEFWKQAESPWQALAVIFELSAAIKSGDPENFVSHMPVHQDGTCNGLQHYAALGGDREGATQVNLVPGEKPSDVYNFVANLAKDILQERIETGDEDAKLLLPIITRKVVKQTVMTNVYGVTYIGAAQQIKKQIGDLFEDKVQSHKLSQYLAMVVFQAMRKLFTNAHEIQDWLGACARSITKSVDVLDLDVKRLEKTGEVCAMSAVIWTTPLGLPVVQPYRQSQKRQVYTNLQTVFISDPFEVSSVYSGRQTTAFAPNFIHSLDATHMLMTAIECGKLGIDFASVHDSYWTHASAVDDMNTVIREKFVQLHSANLIERVKSEFSERYKHHFIMVEVSNNCAVLEKINQFKKDYQKKTGLKYTHKQQLLDEHQKAKGAEIETITSQLSEEELLELYKHTGKNGGTKDSPARNKTKIYLPLRFLDVPKRGEFDVQEVNQSKYFFS